MVYFNPAVVSYLWRVLISLTLLTLTTFLLYRNVKEVGGVTNILTAVTIFSMFFTIIAGFSDFHPEYLATPPQAFSRVGTSVMGISYGLYIIYNFCTMPGKILLLKSINPVRSSPKRALAAIYSDTEIIVTLQNIREF